MSDNQSDNSDDWSVAQPAPEPVAMGVPVGWIDEFGNVFPLGAWVRSEVREKWKPLYTTPPAQPPIDGFGGNLDSAFDVPAVPDGWVMVPREATRDMCVAAVVLNNGNAVYKNVKAEALEIEEQIYAEVYEAMIAAAPGSPLSPLPPLLCSRQWKTQTATTSPRWARSATSAGASIAALRETAMTDKTTPWFPATAKPARKGWYEVRSYPKLHRNHRFNLNLSPFRYWDGKVWRIGGPNEKWALDIVSIFGRHYTHQWRGLTRRAA